LMTLPVAASAAKADKTQNIKTSQRRITAENAADRKNTIQKFTWA
jgi:hypothetical protein